MKSSKSHALCLSIVSVIAGAIACSTETPGSAALPAPVDGTRVQFNLAGGIAAVPWPNDTLCWSEDANDGPCFPNLPTARLPPIIASWVATINATHGWSPSGSIVLPFARATDIPTGPAINLSRLLEVQQDSDWSNDAVYLIDLATGLPHSLDFPTARGDFILRHPVALDPSDPHQREPSLVVETLDERYDIESGTFVPETTKNGEISGEPVYSQAWDADADGVLDVPVMRAAHDCANPPPQGDVSETKRVLRDRCQADGIVDAYDGASDILRIRPRTPLASHRKYAVVVTDRLLDARDRPIVSPFSTVSHPRQEAATQNVRDWLSRPDRAKYYGSASDASAVNIRFVWFFTTASPTGELNRLAEHLQPELFAPKAQVGVVPTRFTIEHTHTLDSDCPTGMPRLAIGELLSALYDLSPGQRQAVVESLAAVARIVTGTMSHVEYAPASINASSAAVTQTSSRVPFWLTIPRNAPDGAAVPIVLVSHEQNSSHFDGLRWAGAWANSGLATLGLEHVGQTPTQFFERARHLERDFRDACIEELLSDLLRTRQDQTAPRDGHQSDIGLDVTQTRDRWRFDAVELASVARSIESHLDIGDSNISLPPIAPAALVGIGTGASAAAQAASLLHGELSVALVDPATSPERAWRRGATWSAPNSDLLQLFGPRIAGVSMSALLPSQTQCGANEVSIRLISSETPTPGSEIGCMPLFGAEGDYLPKRATVVATNLSTLSRRCVRMTARGLFSLGLPASPGDALAVAIYDETAAVVRYGRDDDCNFVGEEPPPLFTLGLADSAGVTAGVVTGAGGLGLERQSPELSQAVDLAEAAFALANPASFVAKLSHTPRATDMAGLLIAISPGNPQVPPDEGLSLARAAGLIPRFPPTNLRVYPELAADTTPEVLAKALARTTPALQVEWARLDEGVPRLRRFPPTNGTCGTNASSAPLPDQLCHPQCSSDADCFGYMTCSEFGTCHMPVPSATHCSESLPDLDGLAGDSAGFGVVRPVPFLRLARYAGRLEADSLAEHWEPQSRQTGAIVQSTHPDWPFIAMALPFADPFGSHGIAYDDVCQRFRYGNYVENLIGRFVATRGTDYPPVTSRNSQQCLVEFPNDKACIAALEGK